MEGSIHPGPAVGKLHPPGRNHIGKEMAMNAFTPIAQGHSPAIESPAAGARRQDAPCITAFRGGARSRGFTLIEMLVSLAITLIMMGAVVTLFGVISESVSGARSAIEMADRLRGAREQLQLDLQGVTATMTPPLRPEMDEGYFEIIEGPSKDDYPHNYAWDDPSDSSDIYVKSQLDKSTPPDPASSWVLFGDTDDVLMFTTRNRRAPFLGKLNGTANESTDAEVVYFLVQDGPLIDTTPIDSLGTIIPTRLCTLYRRVLLVSPSIGPVSPTGTPIVLNNDFFTNNDLSVRYSEPSGTPTFTPNTLGDLTKRENRFAHYGNPNYQTVAGSHPFLMHLTLIPQVPFAAVPTPWPSRTSVSSFPASRPDSNAFLTPLSGSRFGDDVLLTNVLAFDVEVWDPDAPVRVTPSGVAVTPQDPGWLSGTNVATGAYVSLGYNNAASKFGKINPDLYPTTGGPTYGFYDTWSLHYENDGLDQDGSNGADASTNGLDDNANGLVDDVTERDTLPPYNVSLRGIKVTIRVYEPSSQTVREAVVIQNFDTK
jgi:prepilin-type N-terminal cleavage/methylation domain-containing protein